ncbi:MAG: murein biosynthesis integral membrane protein MurJ [Candidatus Berkiellales bacterium]
MQNVEIGEKKKSEQLLKSTTTVSFMTFLSRVVGFLRDMVVANIFGASAGIDAFLLAFKIPNFMRRLFAEGAFSQAFVPVLSEYRATQEPIAVKVLVDRVFGVLSLVLLAVSFIGVVFAPFFVHIFAPGFQIEDHRFGLACQLLQLTFPYIFFISLTAFAGGIQNAYRKFAVPAFTPVLLNFSLIFAAYLLSPYFAEPVEALAWGVLLAGIAQLLFQAPFLAKLALLPSPAWGWHDPGVKRIMTLMVPALVGASVMQVNLLVDTIFASFLPVGSLTWLYYSDRLLEFPIGIFGVALATVVLPHLSQEYTEKSHSGFSASLDWAFRWILLIGIPATVGLTLLTGPLMVTLFQYGRFLPRDAIMAAKSLLTLSLGLVCFLVVKILVSAFYARQNTKFPVKVAIFAMVLNVILNALLIGPLAHAGLALASSLSSICNVLILLWALLRQKIYIPISGWMSFALRLMLANSAMAVVIWWFSPDISAWLEWGATERFMTLLSLIMIAMVTYFGLLWLSGLRYAHMRLQHA